MNSIIISPKFNKENILCINLENKDKKNFKNFKLCFSIIYSIISIENAKIIKQIGRYYEVNLEKKIFYSDEKYSIKINLQEPRIGSYNLSCGPEGVFILDENDKLIRSELKKLKFETPIPKKIYEKIDTKIINPIIPEPFKTSLSNNYLKNFNKKFFSKNKEIQKIWIVELKLSLIKFT